MAHSFESNFHLLDQTFIACTLSGKVGFVVYNLGNRKHFTMFVAANHHSLFTFNEAVSIGIIWYVRQYRPIAETC